jgi:hypothetical protein
MQFSKVHIMQKERDPLNLGSLPSVEPPSDGWPAIRAELEKSRRSRRLGGVVAGSLAAAATVALAIGLFMQQPGDSQPMPVAPEPLAQEQETAPTPGQALDSLIALSQQLERQVRSYRVEFGAMPTDSLVYQVELEDLIAQVDNELSMNPESPELWGRRVNLLLDLSRLYQIQLRRDYHRMASL